MPAVKAAGQNQNHLLQSSSYILSLQQDCVLLSAIRADLKVGLKVSGWVGEDMFEDRVVWFSHQSIFLQGFGLSTEWRS